MEEINVKRLILKETDVLVFHLPHDYYHSRRWVRGFYKHIKERLTASGKHNKILLLPKEIEMSVVGEKEVKEYISNIDLWCLFDDEELT